MPSVKRDTRSTCQHLMVIFGEKEPRKELSAEIHGVPCDSEKVLRLFINELTVAGINWGGKCVSAQRQKESRGCLLRDFRLIRWAACKINTFGFSDAPSHTNNFPLPHSRQLSFSCRFFVWSVSHPIPAPVAISTVFHFASLSAWCYFAQWREKFNKKHRAARLRVVSADFPLNRTRKKCSRYQEKEKFAAFCFNYICNNFWFVWGERVEANWLSVAKWGLKEQNEMRLKFKMRTRRLRSQTLQSFYFCLRKFFKIKNQNLRRLIKTKSTAKLSQPSVMNSQ